ncbi:DUF502 domain-containing protein [Salinarchaeum laminariae]|uniref:DUF502 domain-containing protein n=1 Tax=Salinarchaeum laminariae TaxID=869888 RepID=UPI0020C06152|nr:DUF502 domain-containing protein [Salinarchaeum laminariae]
MWSSIKRDAASGLIVLTPLFATAYTLWWIFQFVAGVPLMGAIARRITVLQVLDPAIARVLLTIGLLFGALVFASWLMRTKLGPFLDARVEASFNHLPGFRVIYNASKIAMETVVDEDVDLTSPAKVELWNEARMTAFPTGRDTEDGRTTVFVPASPVIFVGWVIELDESRIIPADESVEDALIRVISAGFAERSEPPSEADARAVEADGEA